MISGRKMRNHQNLIEACLFPLTIVISELSHCALFITFYDKNCTSLSAFWNSVIVYMHRFMETQFWKQYEIKISLSQENNSNFHNKNGTGDEMRWEWLVWCTMSYDWLFIYIHGYLKLLFLVGRPLLTTCQKDEILWWQRNTTLQSISNLILASAPLLFCDQSLVVSALFIVPFKVTSMNVYAWFV